MRALALVFTAVLVASGCVRFRLDRVRLEEPVPAGEVEALEPGMPLATCLERLGAPLMVWEHGAGMGMAYGASDTFSWGFTVSWSPERLAPAASFSWDDADAELEGAVLQFDADWRLERVRQGMLDDLVPEERKRPQVVSSP